MGSIPAGSTIIGKEGDMNLALSIATERNWTRLDIDKTHRLTKRANKRYSKQTCTRGADSLQPGHGCAENCLQASLV